MVPDPGMPLEEMENWFERGTRRLLDLAVRDRCEGFLLCSTGAVYQPQGRPLCEEDPLVSLEGPLTYGRIRRQVEEQCLKACQRRGISLKIARGFNFAGPRLPENAGFAFSDFQRDAAAGRPVWVKSDGQSVRTYLYASDMASWLWKILLQPSTIETFNVGAKNKIKIKTLAELIGKNKNSSVYILKNKMQNAAGNNFYVPKVEKCKKKLGLKVTKTLKQILKLN